MPDSEPSIRVKAMLVAPDSAKRTHAVSVYPPTLENPDGYHRLIGGGVEVGETHEEAVIREVREELGASIRDLAYLDVVESIYSMNDRQGQEIVFLYTGRLDPEPARQDAELVEADGSQVPVVWRPFDDADEPLPLYPAAAAALVARLMT